MTLNPPAEMDVRLRITWKFHFECSGLEKQVLLPSSVASLQLNVNKKLAYSLAHLILTYTIQKHIVRKIALTYSTREKLFSLTRGCKLYRFMLEKEELSITPQKRSDLLAEFYREEYVQAGHLASNRNLSLTGYIGSCFQCTHFYIRKI